MPACTTESLTNLLSSNCKEIVRANLEKNGSVTVTPANSLSTSPIGEFKRSRSATPTTSDFFQEHFIIKSDWRSHQTVSTKEDEKSLLVKILGWYPCFLLKVLQCVIEIFLPTACVRTLLAIPIFCLSIWLWIFWKIIAIPITIFKCFFDILYFPSLEVFRKKRTVLISGGGSIQTLHLARNFYSTGARVVVCEIEDTFSLARFSTSVSKFYTLPKPCVKNQKSYINALCDIVKIERAAYYIPVNSISSAIFDATAKPILELMGCVCFCPNLKEVLVLNDTLEVFQKCIQYGIPTPPYFTISTKLQLEQFYQNNFTPNKTYILSSSGANNKEKYNILLPPTINELKIPIDTTTKPLIIVEHHLGEHYVTCTTVKQSQVLANVTCKLDDNKCLMPINHQEIEAWLQNFFTKLNLSNTINGHFTFKFLVTKSTNTILPISCKVGVSLPYICHTSVHPRLLWKPCKHFSRQSSGPLVMNKGRYWMHSAFLNAMKRPSVESVTRFIGTVLDMREVLFVYWDPLPYWAYYHLKLPSRNILRFLRQRRFPGLAQL